MTLQHRRPASAYVLEVRPLDRADVEYLRQPSAKIGIKKLRDSHHVVARLIASGLPNSEIARRVGYTPTRVSILKNSPAMQELIAKYREMADQSWKESIDQYNEFVYSAGIKSWRLINDALDEAEESNEPIPLQRLIAIADSSADRVGYHKKSASINYNVDFAANLEKAIARSRQIKQIEE